MNIRTIVVRLPSGESIVLTSCGRQVDVFGGTAKIDEAGRLVSYNEEQHIVSISPGVVFVPGYQDSEVWLITTGAEPRLKFRGIRQGG